MGIRVQQALLSSLLIAALFSAPYLQTVRADEEVATSTEATTNEHVASSTEEVIVEEIASTTEEASVTEDTVTGDPTSDAGEVVAPLSSASARTYNTFSDKPVFLSAYAFFPSHALYFGSKKYRTTALKDGARTYITAIMNQAPVTVSVTADMSALGGSTEYPLQDVYDYIDSNTGTHTIHQFQGDWFTVQSGGASGTTTIPITATDENGDVLTSTITVVLDNTLPTFTIPSITRTATTTLAQGDVLYFSGSLDGTGTEAKPYLVYVYELASDGETVISRTAQDANHPSSLELFALRGGSFSNVPLQIYTIEGTNAFPDDVAYLQYVFSVDDEAGNLITATSSLVSVLPAPPEPEGPKVSSVLFLPGIKGSRLYHEVSVCNGVPGVCDETLWEPYGDILARKLFLDSDGNSEDEVFVKEGQIIDEAGGHRFYKSFIDDMNSKDASDEYGVDWKWRPVAYDWRLSLSNIIHSGAKYGDKIYYDQATSTPYIEQTLRELAHSSPTGRVTIIAHSNGGLVAKALMQELGDAETASLVDKVILVGVPQSGAPQALGGLLFGYDEGIPGKWFTPNIMLSKEVARELAENSPMAYHLMPSYKYLQGVQDPNHSVIGFSGSHLYQVEQASYGSSVDTVAELDDFLLAREGGREKPAYADLTVANILNPNLISYANSTHDSLDSWVPPASVTLYQIAGWGANTVSGIDFYDEQKVLGTTVGYKRQYRPIFVEDGDGVVPVPSALLTSAASNVHDYWLDMARQGAKSGKKKHGDIFEVNELRSFLINLLVNDPALPSFLSTSVPAAIPGNRLIFQLHSPLTLGIYDTEGNYTGLNSDGSISENVSGAEYGEFGDVKYLIAPAGQEYTLALHGQSGGAFSLDIQEQTGNTITTSTTFADVPTTAQTTASLTITNGVTDASSLTVDEDGDGSTDIELAPAAGETTTYTAPATEVADTSSGTSSGSKPTVQSLTEPVTAATDESPTVTQIPTVSQSREQTYTAVGTQIQDPIFESTNSSAPSSDPEQNHAQTASVYDAFTPLTEWIRSLLYNTWEELISFFKNLFSRS